MDSIQALKAELFDIIEKQSKLKMDHDQLEQLKTQKYQALKAKERETQNVSTIR